MTQHDTATSRTFLKVTLQESPLSEIPKTLSDYLRIIKEFNQYRKKDFVSSFKPKVNKISLS